MTFTPKSFLLAVDAPSGVATITLNRPERLNALTFEVYAELRDLFPALDADPSVRAIVLTGAGRGFCSGGDVEDIIGALFGRDAAGLLEFTRMTCDVVANMRRCRRPIIAALNGTVAGAGAVLAAASDVRFAAESARIAFLFVKVGLSGADMGVSWMLPRLVGASRAFELLLTGRLIDSTEADRIGLVTRVVPDGDVVDSALETAGLILGNSPFGVRMTKEVMWSQLEIGSLQAGIDLENRTQILSSMTSNMEEATAAFFEKRPASFSEA